MKLRIISTVALTTALLATGSIAASAAPIDDSKPSPECQVGEKLVAAWLHLPADLRSDLKDLRDVEPGTDRQQAAKDIRDGALDGEYGPGVQEGAEKLQGWRVRVYADLPPELRADLKDLRAAEPGERADLARDIAQNALAGEYGDKAQATAERICA